MVFDPMVIDEGFLVVSLLGHYVKSLWIGRSQILVVAVGGQRDGICSTLNDANTSLSVDDLLVVLSDRSCNVFVLH